MILTRYLSRIAYIGAVVSLASLAGCGGTGPANTSGLNGADRVAVELFPEAHGRTVEQIARAAGATAGTTLAPAAADFLANTKNRFPFGLLDTDRAPVIAPTVVYVARSKSSAATGPYIAIGASLRVPPAFQSQSSAQDTDIAPMFYRAALPLGKAGKYTVMALTKTRVGMLAAALTIEARSSDPTPRPGQKVPRIDTPTVTSAGGLAKIETREPPDDMHDVSFRDALGQNKPVVLVFATPALCVSRMCGPIVDIAASVQAKYKNRAIFIHQEIFNDNDPNKGYRPQIGSFGLISEPFTFVVKSDGTLAARFEGPVAAEELDSAVAANL